MSTSFFVTGTRIFKNVFLGLWRSKLFVFFTILSLSLLFLLLYLFSLGSIFSQSVLNGIEKKADIAVFIDKDVSPVRLDAFRNELLEKKRNREIYDFWELTSKNALEEFQKKYPNETQFLKKYNLGNPFYSVFGIVPIANKTSTEKIENWILSDTWSAVIDQNRFRQHIATRERVKKFVGLTSFFGKSLLALQAFFALIAFVLVFYAVSLLVRSHEKEISIMRLVGAHLLYIRLPFILEGVIIVSAALAISVLLFLWILSFFQKWGGALLAELELEKSGILLSHETLQHILFFHIGAIFFLALFSAIFAVEHVLRQKSFSHF